MKRQRLYPRHLTKDGAIYSSIIPLYLLYSSMNKVAVEEELIQINHILKLVVAAHEECKQYLKEE